MKIKIAKKITVGEIKRQFSTDYPFLKIEFLIPPHLPSGGRHPIIAADNTMLGNIHPMMKEGAMVVNGMTTVHELETFFHNHLLDVQVFRQSEKLWLETTMTDGWTLEKQNTHGREISQFKYHTKPERNYGNDVVNGAG